MISVCIATHNGEKYIKQQLDSILFQLDQDDEVVISDDGSTDGTLSVINEMKDSRIKVFHYIQPSKTKHPHVYVCRNFENALQHARGDYLFLSDQDDVWMPNKVEVCMNDLKYHDLVLHDFSHIDDSETVTKDLHYNGKFRSYNLFLLAGKHYGCAMAFKRYVLDYVLPFPSHLLLHDFWIGILVELQGNFYFEKKSLLKYRIHNQNTSNTHNSYFFKVFYRILTCIYLFARIVRYNCFLLFKR